MISGALLEWIININDFKNTNNKLEQTKITFFTLSFKP